MTNESETNGNRANQGDVLAAWVVYLVVVFGLVGYGLVSVFA